jgi:hypothetical protein
MVTTAAARTTQSLTISRLRINRQKDHTTASAIGGKKMMAENQAKAWFSNWSLTTSKSAKHRLFGKYSILGHSMLGPKQEGVMLCL